jgi:hypothetical protein
MDNKQSTNNWWFRLFKKKEQAQDVHRRVHFTIQNPKDIWEDWYRDQARQVQDPETCYSRWARWFRFFH